MMIQSSKGARDGRMNGMGFPGCIEYPRTQECQWRRVRISQDRVKFRTRCASRAYRSHLTLSPFPFRSTYDSIMIRCQAHECRNKVIKPVLTMAPSSVQLFASSCRFWTLNMLSLFKDSPEYEARKARPFSPTKVGPSYLFFAKIILRHISRSLYPKFMLSYPSICSKRVSLRLVYI